MKDAITVVRHGTDVHYFANAKALRDEGALRDADMRELRAARVPVVMKLDVDGGWTWHASHADAAVAMLSAMGAEPVDIEDAAAARKRKQAQQIRLHYALKKAGKSGRALVPIELRNVAAPTEVVRVAEVVAAPDGADQWPPERLQEYCDRLPLPAGSKAAGQFTIACDVGTETLKLFPTRIAALCWAYGVDATNVFSAANRNDKRYAVVCSAWDSLTEHMGAAADGHDAGAPSRVRIECGRGRFFDFAPAPKGAALWTPRTQALQAYWRGFTAPPTLIHRGRKASWERGLRPDAAQIHGLWGVAKPLAAHLGLPSDAAAAVAAINARCVFAHCRGRRVEPGHTCKAHALVSTPPLAREMLATSTLKSTAKRLARDAAFKTDLAKGLGVPDVTVKVDCSQQCYAPRTFSVCIGNYASRVTHMLVDMMQRWRIMDASGAVIASVGVAVEIDEETHAVLASTQKEVARDIVLLAPGTEVTLRNTNVRVTPHALLRFNMFDWDALEPLQQAMNAARRIERGITAEQCLEVVRAMRGEYAAWAAAFTQAACAAVRGVVLECAASLVAAGAAAKQSTGSLAGVDIDEGGRAPAEVRLIGYPAVHREIREVLARAAVTPRGHAGVRYTLQPYPGRSEAAALAHMDTDEGEDEAMEVDRDDEERVAVHTEEPAAAASSDTGTPQRAGIKRRRSNAAPAPAAASKLGARWSGEYGV